MKIDIPFETRILVVLCASVAIPIITIMSIMFLMQAPTYDKEATCQAMNGSYFEDQPVPSLWLKDEYGCPRPVRSETCYLGNERFCFAGVDGWGQCYTADWSTCKP